MTYRFAATALAGGVLAAVVTLALGDSPASHVWWVVAPALSALIVALGMRRHRPAHAGPWKVLLASLGLFWAGWTLGAVEAETALGADLAVVGAASDVLNIVGYLGVALTALLMVRHRIGDGDDRDNVIDALVVATSVAMVLWGALLDEQQLAPGVADHERLLILFSPVLTALAVGAGVRVLFAQGTRLVAAWLLGGASVLTFLGNLWTSHLVGQGEPAQHTGIDTVWMLAFAAVAAAAAHPSMRQLTQRVAPVEAPLSFDRMILLGGALLVGPITHVQVADQPAAVVGLVAVTSAVIAALILWRMVRLLREHERARRALAAAARRDSVVAAISQQALADRPLGQLLDDAAVQLRGALDGAHCAVVPPRAGAAVGGAGATVVGVDDGLTRVAEIVAVGEHQRPLTPAEGEFLATVAALLSAAARQRTAEARLRHQVLHDVLTGLPNRALLLDRLRHRLARRGADPVVVVFVDMDGFKGVNDTWGHEAGDRLLEEVAQRMRGAVRAGDTVARLAGDEFVVLIDDPCAADVPALVARVLAAVGDAVAALGHGGRHPAVTASAGVARGLPGGVDAEQLLRHADTAMYAAKQRGGGVAVWASEDGAVPWQPGADPARPPDAGPPDARPPGTRPPDARPADARPPDRPAQRPGAHVAGPAPSAGGAGSSPGGRGLPVGPTARHAGWPPEPR